MQKQPCCPKVSPQIGELGKFSKQQPDEQSTAPAQGHPAGFGVFERQAGPD